MEGSSIDLQHGSQANNLWFVFANVTSNCPICVQYLIRSPYVISSLRPAYARVYPATREDLAAETFFHMQTGSTLVSGITDDDFITWFGKNDTSRNTLDLENYPGCEIKTTTPTTLLTTPSPVIPIHKIPTTLKTTVVPNNSKKRISVTSYTINVDDTIPTTDSKKYFNLKTNLLQKNISTNSTVEKGKIIMAQNKTEKKTKTKPVLHKNSITITKNIIYIKNETNHIPKVSKLIKTTTRPTTNNTYNITQNTTSSTEKYVSQTPETDNSKKETIEIKLPRNDNKITLKTNENKTDLHEKNKHVNKEIQQLPAGTIVDQETSTTSNFPDEKEKNFLVLDKNALWGMLREVVHDEMDKEKSKEKDGRKLRFQGYT